MGIDWSFRVKYRWNPKGDEWMDGLMEVTSAVDSIHGPHLSLRAGDSMWRSWAFYEHEGEYWIYHKEK